MILFNDRIMAKESISISPDDRGYYYGDGVYEVFRVYNGRIFAQEAHFQRLQRSTEATRIEIPYPIADIAANLALLLAAEHIQDGTIYLQITRGIAPRALPFPTNTPPILYAYCSEMARPLHTMQHGIKAITAADIRWLRCDLKTLNLMGNVLAKQEALDRGVQEVIMHRDGIITECSASNLMIAKNGILHTHPANHLILPGITRAVVLKLAEQLQIRCVEQPFHLDELMAADEVFITGTTVEVTPIIEIDQQPIAQGMAGPLTQKLQEAFQQQALPDAPTSH